MGKIACKEVREKAVKAYKTGKYTQQQVADMYDIHYKTLQNWLKVDARGEPQIPQKRGCPPRALTEDDVKRIDATIQEDNSITLAGIKEKLQLKCCLPVIFNAVKALGYTHKKKFYEHQKLKEKI